MRQKDVDLVVNAIAMGIPLLTSLIEIAKRAKADGRTVPSLDAFEQRTKELLAKPDLVG